MARRGEGTYEVSKGTGARLGRPCGARVLDDRVAPVHLGRVGDVCFVLRPRMLLCSGSGSAGSVLCRLFPGWEGGGVAHLVMFEVAEDTEERVCAELCELLFDTGVLGVRSELLRRASVAT